WRPLLEARRDRRSHPTHLVVRRRGTARHDAHASTSRRRCARRPHASRISLHAGERLVIPKQQLLVFLERLLRDFLGNGDDGLVVLRRPRGLEASPKGLEPKFLQPPP